MENHTHTHMLERGLVVKNIDSRVRMPEFKSGSVTGEMYITSVCLSGLLEDSMNSLKHQAHS